MRELLHSAEFTLRWKSLLKALYGFKDGPAGLYVPGVLTGKTMVYLPLLNYTDKSLNELQSEALSPWLGSWQSRGLDFDCAVFEPNDTVTMRLDIAGMSVDDVFKKRIHTKCRNQIRKAQKSGLTLSEGGEAKLVSDFYRVFASTMHRYGTPVFPRKLFELLPAHVNARYLVAYQGGVPIAGLCVISDGPLAWVPWAGSEHAFRSLCPNHLLYWAAIQGAVQAGQAVFDFGRSAFGGATYVFKRDWGAQAVKIAILSDAPQDIYGKYALAARVWQHLPRWAVDRLGPWLCGRLPDL